MAGVCPHGLAGGLTYGPDKELICQDCALVAPPFGIVDGWIDNRKAGGWSLETMDQMMDDCSLDDFDFVFSVANAVYAQHGGRFDVEGSPVADDRHTYIVGFALTCLADSPHARPLTHGTTS